MKTFTKLLLSLVVMLFLASNTVSAAGGRVNLSHLSLTLPNFIVPVDVGTGREARFDCVPPDFCVVYVDFFGTYDLEAAYIFDADRKTNAYIETYLSHLSDQGIDVDYASRINVYRATTKVQGDRERVFVTDSGNYNAIDFFLTYSRDGLRVIKYVRPATWTLQDDGTGLPIFEKMLDSLTLNVA